MRYKSNAEDPHWQEEEQQWARILSEGDPVKGMLLVLMQKACTAFHEFAPAFKAGAIDVSQTDFFRKRLAKRVKMLIEAMETNGLRSKKVYDPVVLLLERVESADSASALADLTEVVHQLGHKLCDSLQQDEIQRT